MLNITSNSVKERVKTEQYVSMAHVNREIPYKTMNQFLKIFSILALVVLFLPWTQTVRGHGYVTTRNPDQRPQTIHSAIPGRIEKWYVREGDYVNKGDTIIFISEIKDDYFDPNLLERTATQVQAKDFSVTAYNEKVKALSTQIQALSNERKLKAEQANNKLLQARLKVQSDSIDLQAAKTQISIAQRQYDRVLQLNEEGLKAMTDVEEKRLKLQESQAKLISQENKLLAAKNEVLNATVEINRIQAEYADKIAKAESDKYTAISGQYDAQADRAKLENQYSNYSQRLGMHYILSPQSGFVNRTLQSGIGETFKEGDPILSIMPTNFDMAVETFINPLDLPLIHKGEKVRIQFDGWPAIVFSGWPNVSYGTYGGVVVAKENFISSNGKYRILIAPDPEDVPWPEALQVGSGANALALLNDVQIWYELWRQLNGFPANYYLPSNNTKNQAAAK